MIIVQFKNNQEISYPADRVDIDDRLLIMYRNGVNFACLELKDVKEYDLVKGIKG